MLTELESAIGVVRTELEENQLALEQTEVKIQELTGSMGTQPKVKYISIDDAINHKTTLSNLHQLLS